MTDKMSSTDPTRAARDGIFQILELLACPDCRGSLSEAEGSLVCDGCARTFAVANGIPQLLPMLLAAGSPADPAWHAWAGALDRLVAWRRRTWDEGASGKGLQGRVHAIQAAFADHSRLAEAHGLALDVGCGSAEIATTLGNECRYVGVDPLPLATRGGPPLVRGVGERLPFHAETFDLVLVLETLDHCQSPARLFAEVCRVLKPDGILCVEQYLSRPGFWERLRRWWEGSAGPRPAPCDGSKVVLLDESDVLGLIREAFAEVRVGMAPGGSHLFARAGGKRQAPEGR